MYCTRCGADNPEDANFCARCGQRLQHGEPNTTTRISPEHEMVAPDAEAVAHAAGIERPELDPGQALLVVVRGPNEGARFLLEKDAITCGRHPDCDIFLDDVTVSRNHATFHRHDHSYTVKDDGSLNGTYVNGERVETQALATGDEVQIGRFKLITILAAEQAQ